MTKSIILLFISAIALSSCGLIQERALLTNAKEIFPSNSDETLVRSIKEQCIMNDKAETLISSYQIVAKEKSDKLILLSFYPDRYDLSGSYVYSLACDDSFCKASIYPEGNAEAIYHGKFVKSEIVALIDSEMNNPLYTTAEDFVHNRCYIMIDEPFSAPRVFAITDNLSDGTMGNLLLRTLLSEQ